MGILYLNLPDLATYPNPSALSSLAPLAPLAASRAPLTSRAPSSLAALCAPTRPFPFGALRPHPCLASAPLPRGTPPSCRPPGPARGPCAPTSQTALNSPRVLLHSAPETRATLSTPHASRSARSRTARSSLLRPARGSPPRALVARFSVPRAPPWAASFLPPPHPLNPAPLRAHGPAGSSWRTWADPRAVRAAVPHRTARLVAEAARGPAGDAGRIAAGTAAAQRGAALPGPERARRPPGPGHPGHHRQGERQGQDPRRAAQGRGRAQAGDRTRTPAGTDPTWPAPSWGGGYGPDPSPDPPPTCQGADARRPLVRSKLCTASGTKIRVITSTTSQGGPTTPSFQGDRGSRGSSKQSVL